MEKKKQTYESPEIQETRVELESSICSGSVFDEKDEQKLTIKTQDVAPVTGNDFSDNAWEVPSAIE